MSDELFLNRKTSFKEEGETSSFNIAAVAEALDIITELKEKNIGTETVEARIGEYKSWDPDIFRVDKDTENKYIERLKGLNINVVLLSEEIGRLDINFDKKTDVVYAVSDPFDGSFLFKRGISDFWYSSLAFFDKEFKPISCAVGDAISKVIAYANDKGSFITKLENENIIFRFKLDEKYRKTMGRKNITEIKNASIESYAMKPKKFLFPLVDEYRELLTDFKFFLPNGGPYGFVDIAEGKIDVYFALRQPFVDVFSGIYIAMQAGAVVTDFNGNEVKFTDNVKSVHDVVASTNKILHEKVLELIKKCKIS